jgi:ferredoxin--NADP+ reductase
VHAILSREELAPAVVRFWIQAPAVARNRRAGQFVIIRLDENGERIPLTIADSDKASGTIALVVQAVGKTTKQLNAMQPGQSILDVAGPLGQPTHIVPGTRLCVVGGGIGTAVVLPIAREVKRTGGHVSAIIGARTKDLIILEQDMRAIAQTTIVTTDDGSYGKKGFVTDALRDLLIREREWIDEVVAVGPLPMMRAVCDVTKRFEVKTIVSLNPVMVDGTGMCGGCRVTVGGEQKFVCVDGAEFDGHQVDFAELMARLGAYREQELAALARCEGAGRGGGATRAGEPGFGAEPRLSMEK